MRRRGRGEIMSCPAIGIPRQNRSCSRIRPETPSWVPARKLCMAVAADELRCSGWTVLDRLTLLPDDLRYGSHKIKRTGDRHESANRDCACHQFDVGCLQLQTAGAYGGFYRGSASDSQCDRSCCARCGDEASSRRIAVAYCARSDHSWRPEVRRHCECGTSAQRWHYRRKLHRRGNLPNLYRGRQRSRRIGDVMKDCNHWLRPSRPRARRLAMSAG